MTVSPTARRGRDSESSGRLSTRDFLSKYAKAIGKYGFWPGMRIPINRYRVDLLNIDGIDWYTFLKKPIPELTLILYISRSNNVS